MSLPKPYYETELGRLYHADCLDILPNLEPVDLVLTDPPYGVGNFVQQTGNKRGEYVDWNESPPPSQVFEVLKSMSKYRIIWGANYFNCFESGAIVWVKNQPMPDFSKADLASCSFYKKVELVTITWTNFVNSKQSDHPCERPVSLYEWCVNYTPKAESVLDPFLGSGTTAVACERLKRRWIGIEIEEKYCAIAAKRIEAERRQLKLF
jgi:DNA modification methylase